MEKFYFQVLTENMILADSVTMYVLLDKIGHYDYILNVLVNHKIFFGLLIPLGTVDKYRTRPIADSKPFHCTTFVWKSQLYMTMIWTFLGAKTFPRLLQFMSRI